MSGLKRSNQMNTVSIIIPTYNTSSLTLNCIESLLKYKNNCSIDITVVDNGNDNTDGRRRRALCRYVI